MKNKSEKTITFCRNCRRRVARGSRLGWQLHQVLTIICAKCAASFHHREGRS